MNNKVSVCIATYNGEKFIKEQLDSILSQLEATDEVIISDDSSTDKTIEIIKSYQDKRIQLYENQTFKSPIFNFENALKLSQGEYIFLADQDDIWRADKIKIVKYYLKKYDVVLSDAKIIDENGKEISQSFFELSGSKSGFIKNLVKNTYLGCAMAFNRRVLEKALPFPKDLPMHDWWIGLVAELYGNTYFIEDKLISYRRHGNNLSSTGAKSQNSVFKKIILRIIMVKNLSLLYFKKNN
jgi:glycosyltransferase involved in cell wall biosynthesis